MKELPTVQADSGSSDSGPPRAPQVASVKLMATLAVAGAVAGLLIVLVFQWADPQIQAHRAAALRAALLEVLSGPASYRSLYVSPAGLSMTPPAGVDTVTAEKVYIGYDDAGDVVGYAVTGGEPGFQDIIQLIFGYDAGQGRLLGMMVLESKETPGLGDKIFKDLDFVAEFQGVATPIEGVKLGAGSGADNEIDMITGATISSRTVIDIINHRLEALGTALKDHVPEPAPPPTPAASAEQPAAGDEGEEGS